MPQPECAPPPLDGIVVVDLSTGIPGAYCTRQLADGGAAVIKIESPLGDPLRRWSAGGVEVDPESGGALFQFLACTKKGVVVDPGRPEEIHQLIDLVRSAHVVVWSPGSALAALAELHPLALRQVAPHAVVCAITSFGLTGPWADRPATEFTLSAMSGGAGSMHGDSEVPPSVPGGRLVDWTGGMVAATALLLALQRSTLSGEGDLVDVSLLEAGMLTQSMYPMTFFSIAGVPFRPKRMTNLPGIHQAKDGLVGFMTVTGQQWLDFCLLVEKPEWCEDPTLIRMDVRNGRRAELTEVVDAWVSARTVAEIVDQATAFRIPVAPVGNGETIPTFEQFADQGFYMTNPGGGFLQPAVPYRLGGTASVRPLSASPRLGEHTEQVISAPRTALVATGGTPTELPLSGLRVADFTAFWAGPIVGHVLAMFGAEVIHVESPSRPDGMRFNTLKTMSDPDWWEWSPLFQGPNGGKRGFAVDLTNTAGQDLARRLVEKCDIVIENYSPRVLPSWGLGYDQIKAVNPAAIVVRMPAFGLAGPWRDRVGYAQTMEQASGLAWLTGFPDRVPDIPNGPCDPIAGFHAATALLLALEHRRRTGEGMLVEVPMISGALNLAAEQVVEYSAYGSLLQRMGNRSPGAAPQNLYASAEVVAGEDDHWVAVSVETDVQWECLRRALGDPAWARGAELATMAGRRQYLDEIDGHLSAWCASRSARECEDVLIAAGVPAAVVLRAHEQDLIPQLAHRGFLETVQHPVTGDTQQYAYPARFEHGPEVMNRAPAPTLGQDNEYVLREILALDDAVIASLLDEGIVGSTAPQSKAW